jgi:hypothetical protein
MTDGLVTALEKDGYPSREACLADSELERVAADCDLLFTTMARFASPEVKREVLAILLKERLESLGWTAMNKFATQLGYQLAADYEDDCPGARQEFLNSLAPLEAP